MKKVTLLLISIFLILITILLYNTFKYKPNYNYVINNSTIQSDTIKEKFKLRNFEINKIKKYEIEARVLSIKEYSRREDAYLMTYDLALGWNEMSDIKYLKDIKISQRNRWYYWRTKRNELSKSKIEHNSSNHHIIHANENIKKILSNLKEHQVINMKGYLVNAQNLKNKKITLNSSLSRKDIGAGACEILYLEEIEIIN